MSVFNRIISLFSKNGGSNKTAVEIEEGIVTGFTGSPEVFFVQENVTGFDKYAFCSCSSLRQVSVPGSVYELPEGVFSACSALQSVRMPGGTLKKIGPRAFSRCTSLPAVTVPDSVA